MDFKITTIAPKGRNKYGNYTSRINASRVSESVIVSAIGGGDTEITTPSPDSSSFLLILSHNSMTFDGEEIAAADRTDRISVVGYKGADTTDVYVGKIDSTASQTDYSIIGIPDNGMTVTVENNGSRQTTLVVTIDHTIEVDRGILQIPTAVYTKLDDEEELGDDISAWNSLSDDCKVMWLEYTWSINKSTASPYTLDLTNDTATINCDEDGNILSGAERPSCKATMYYGDSETSATYAMTVPSDRNVVGLTINGSNGTLTFGNDFSFDGKTLEITITAISAAESRTKIMTVTKAFPGSDGTPATSKWIVSSVDTVVIDPDTGIKSVETISAEVFKQIGDGAVEKDTSEKIYYGWDVTTPLTIYTAPISVDASKTYLKLALKKSDGTIYESETIPILKNGPKGDDGEQGPQGRQGASVRGPVDYDDQTEARRWCNGILIDDTHMEDGQYLDIIFREESGNPAYYYCSTSYDGNGCNVDDWEAVKGNWTRADQQYNFVATNVLLAENAKIKFTTNNAISLIGADGNVTAGAQGGDGTSFWAGSENPDSAPFKVGYDGTVEATKGTFGCVEIGDVDGWGDSLIAQGTSVKTVISDGGMLTEYDGDADNGKLPNTILIDPEGKMGDSNAPISIVYQNASGGTSFEENNAPTAIDTNGSIRCNEVIMKSDKGNGNNYFPLTSLLEGVKVVFLTKMPERFLPSSDPIYGTLTRLTNADINTYTNANLDLSDVGFYAYVNGYNATLTAYGHPDYILLFSTGTIYLTMEDE